MKMMPLLSLIVAMSAVFASSANSSLPDGSGVVTLQGACSSCYQSSRNSGRTADDGRDVVGMAANVGVPVRASEAAATIVPASDIHVAIKEWRVPTSGSHAHDPLATRDGAIWLHRPNGQSSRTARSKDGAIPRVTV